MNISNNKNAINEELRDKWVLMEKKTFNNQNQINDNNNLIIFFEITVEPSHHTRHILKILTPIYAKINSVIEKVKDYLISIKIYPQFFIFQGRILNLEKEKNLFELGIRNGAHIIIQEPIISI